MKKLISISIVVISSFTTFSQKIIFQLQEKRTHYLTLDGAEANFVDIIEPTNSILIFDLKDSLLSVKSSNGVTVSKISKITKKKHQYFFETVDKYTADLNQTVVCYYMIDCKNHIGYQKYIGFCIKDMWRVTDFKSNNITMK